MADLLALYENVIVDEGDATVNNNAATLDEHSVDQQLWKALNQGNMQQLHTLLSMIKSRNSISFRHCLDLSIDAAVNSRVFVFVFLSVRTLTNKHTPACLTDFSLQMARPLLSSGSPNFLKGNSNLLKPELSC